MAQHDGFRRWMGSGLLVSLVTCHLALAAGGVARADEPSNAALLAEIQALKTRLAQLEAKVGTSNPSFSSEPAGGPSKPGAPTLQLPSGLSGLQMSGYVDTSYIMNLEQADAGKGRATRARTFDTQPNGFTPNAFNLALEKPLSDESLIGFRTDILAGTDAQIIHSTGLGAPAGAGDAVESFDLEQAYAMLRVPVGKGVDIKVGKFVTLWGSEVIRSMDNWNFSRSYMFGFSIPFTHTGALVSYPIFGDKGSATIGVVNGWDTVVENNQFKTMLGSVSLTPIEKVTLTANWITGAERTADNRNDRSMIDLVAMWQPAEKLTLMANYDYGHESGLVHGVAGTSGFDSANWTGLALYAKYDITPTWSLAGRGEWFNDMAGVRTGLTGPSGTLENGINFYGWTLTSQWKLQEHVLARLEYRRDTADEHVFFHDKSGFLNYQDTLAAEVIYHF